MPERSFRIEDVSFCSCKRIKNVFKSILPKDVSLNLYFSPMTVSINSQTSRLCFINAYRQICFATSVGCDAIAETRKSSSRA